MSTIPQRELRNHVCDVLRRAEGGEQFVITIDGRPVADLGPHHHRRRWVSRDRLRGLKHPTATPVEIEDLRRSGGELGDPFTR